MSVASVLVSIFKVKQPVCVTEDHKEALLYRQHNFTDIDVN